MDGTFLWYFYSYIITIFFPRSKKKYKKLILLHFLTILMIFLCLLLWLILLDISWFSCCSFSFKILFSLLFGFIYHGLFIFLWIMLSSHTGVSIRFLFYFNYTERKKMLKIIYDSSNDIWLGEKWLDFIFFCSSAMIGLSLKQLLK